MENWQSAETQKDIEQMMSAYGDFHDACIVSLNFQSGAFVDDKSAMHFGGPEERVLSVVFQRQWEPKTIGQHRTIAEASAVESPIRQETIGFPAHFFARAHNFKPPGRACQPEADSPMRT